MTAAVPLAAPSLETIVQQPPLTVFHPSTQSVIHPDSWDAVFELREDPYIAQNFMNPLEAYHSGTAHHSMDVAYHTDVLAKYVGLPDEQREELRKAALLHDYGKIKIPREILDSTKKLNREQRNTMAQHVRLGFEPIKRLLGVRVAAIMAGHHEKQNDPNADESGSVRPYPRTSGEFYEGTNRRVYDESIERSAELLAATDQVVSLLGRRTYRSSMTPGDARELLRKQFTGDQNLIDLLLPEELIKHPELKPYLFPSFERRYKLTLA